MFCCYGNAFENRRERSTECICVTLAAISQIYARRMLINVFINFKATCQPNKHHFPETVGEHWGSGGKALHRLILESRKYSVGQFKAMSHTSFDLVLYGNFYQKRYLLYNRREGFYLGIQRRIVSAAICSALFFTRLIGVSKPSSVNRALGTYE